MKIFSELQSHEFLMEHVFCPHRAVRELPSVTSQDHAKDEVYCTELIFRNTGCLRQKSEIYFFP